MQYATGVECSTQHLKRHHFRSRHTDQYPWHGWLVEAGQLVTDVGNWSRVQSGGVVTMLALTGRMTLAHLKAVAAIAHAKGITAGSGFLAHGLPLPLPPLMPLLRSAQLHVSGALAAAAAAGAPGAGAAAVGSGVGFGGFGVFATLLMAPSAVVTAGFRRPLASGGAVAAAGAGAVVLAPPAADSGAAGRQATLALTAASSSGVAGPNVARGALGRFWEQVGRALQRPPTRQRQDGRRAAVVAGAAVHADSGGAGGGMGPAQRAGRVGVAFVRGLTWLGGSAARVSGAIATASRHHAASSSSTIAAALGGQGGLLAAAAQLRRREALLLAGGIGGGDRGDADSGMHKSASCSSIVDVGAACAGSTAADTSGSVQCGSGGSGGGGGRQTLHLPVPRLSWLRRRSEAIVLRSA